LDWADFLFLPNIVMREEDRQKFLSQNLKKEFLMLSDRLEGAESFTPQTAESVFRDVVAELGMQSSDLVHPVRVALTGKSVGPGLFETMNILGKEKTVQRLRETFK
ncbi:MAG: hypothetical protein NT079_00155, partial [Candidatus Omnitrophica bacterium]|nr:hypothetical protein [Candidatus Omnitrophota bacterium]